jgi:hypothetical protein
MKRLSGTSLCLVAALFLAFTATSTYAASKPKVDPNAKLRAALYTAQTVYFVNDYAASDQGSKKSATAFYPLVFVPVFNALQGMGRYQLVPSTTGADLVFQQDWNAGIKVLDGKTLQLIGTFSFTGGNLQKYTAKLLNQLRDLAGDSRSLKTIVPIPPTPLIVRMDEGGDDSALLHALQSSHSVFMIEKDTFPAPKKTPYQPGQMVAMLGSDLTAWARYRPVSSVADADLVVTFAVDDGCVGNGTKSERVGSWMKVPVADFKCDGGRSLGLVFRDAKTLQMLGSIWIDQPDLSIKPNQPNPRDVTFEKLIDVWKSKAAMQAP